MSHMRNGKHTPQPDEEALGDRMIMRLKYVRHTTLLVCLAALGIIRDWVFYWRNKYEVPPSPGKIVIVTGGSRGIGLAVVRKLLISDMEVIIACRHRKAGEEAIQNIRNSGVTTGIAKIYILDNSSLESVRTFAAKIKDDYEKIHILINNAGIMFSPDKLTVDGFEQQYAINYLSHFLLTALLLPLLKKAGETGRCGRIVNVASFLHWAGDMNFDDINNSEHRLIRFRGYSQSKLAQIISTMTLARLFKGKDLPIKIYAVHPGFANTTIVDHWYWRALIYARQKVYKSLPNSATPIVYAATCPTLEMQSGIYIDNCFIACTKSCTNDISVQNKLFYLSLKQVSLKDFFEEVTPPVEPDAESETILKEENENVIFPPKSPSVDDKPWIIHIENETK